MSSALFAPYILQKNDSASCRTWSLRTGPTPRPRSKSGCCTNTPQHVFLYVLRCTRLCHSLLGHGTLEAFLRCVLPFVDVLLCHGQRRTSFALLYLPSSRSAGMALNESMQPREPVYLCHVQQQRCLMPWWLLCSEESPSYLLPRAWLRGCQCLGWDQKLLPVFHHWNHLRQLGICCLGHSKLVVVKESVQGLLCFLHE